jgi:hypothetical protein
MSRYEREGVKGALAVWSVLESFTVRHVPDTLVSPKQVSCWAPTLFSRNQGTETGLPRECITLCYMCLLI